MAINLSERPVGTKAAKIHFGEDARPPETILIEPGTKTSDVMRKFHFDDDFLLFLGSESNTFGWDENLYPKVADGAILNIASKIQAGN